MARKRRNFSPRVKAEAVQFVLVTGRPIAEIAQELEINEGTLCNWVNEWKRVNPESEMALTPVERALVAEMEDEIRGLRLENEFQKEEQLSQASPDLLREMLAVFINTLMSAEADAVCGAACGTSSPDRVKRRNGYRVSGYDLTCWSRYDLMCRCPA